MALPKTLPRNIFYGLQVSTFSIVEPKLQWFPVDVNSAPIRPGDPVQQVAGGGMSRLTPSSTTIAGIAASGNVDTTPASIGHVTNLQGYDATGRVEIPVYLADVNTFFRGECRTAPSAANLLKTYNLQYAIADADVPTGVVTNGGTAGATTYNYKISAVSANGETAVAAAITTTTGNVTLSSTNYNIITIPAIANVGALNRVLWYNVYRNVSGTYYLIGSVPASLTASVVFNDIGQTAGVAAPTLANQTGWVIDNTTSSTNIVQIRDLDTTPNNPQFANSPASPAVSPMALFTLYGAQSQIQGTTGS